MIYIGIDAGTQSTKTLAFDADTGTVLASAAAAYDLIPNLPPGNKEQDPQVWLDAIDSTMQEVLAQVDRVSNRKNVRGIGVSGQQHGFVPLDGNDRVIRPAKLWNDTSTAAECQEIMDACGGAEEFQRRSGNRLPPGFTAGKVLWLKKHEPQNFAKLCWVLLPHDYINFWLSGVKCMEYGDASGTGLLNVASRSWYEKAVYAIDANLAGKLPPLALSSEPCGTLTASLVERWNLPPGVVISAGGGDNMMGAIGTGNVRAGVVTCSLGTSGTIYACSDTPVTDPGGDIAAFCDSTGKWLPLVCTMNVTVATEMVRQRFAMDHATASAAAASVAPGSDGLMLVPFFEGERTPNCPDGTGVFFGIRPATFDAPHMMRAAMEGATLGLNYGFTRLRELGVCPAEVRLTGGGAKSAVWRQILADVFDVPVVCLKIEEGAALGAALQAMWAAEGGEVASLADRFLQPDESTRAVPDAARVALYRESQVLFNRLAGDLRESFAMHRKTI